MREKRNKLLCAQDGVSSQGSSSVSSSRSSISRSGSRGARKGGFERGSLCCPAESVWQSGSLMGNELPLPGAFHPHALKPRPKRTDLARCPRSHPSHAEHYCHPPVHFDGQ